MMHDKPTVLDLFAGCGGFSLGAHMAGLDVALAVDVDPVLTASFATNFVGTPLVRCDVSRIEPSVLERGLPRGRVTGIVGGPPCQAFSEIGRHRRSDERRDLVGHFFRIVKALRPSFFVMENVRGLGFSHNRNVLEKALNLVADRYDVVGPMVLDASRFGAPTRRGRLFVVGVDRTEWDLPNPADLLTPARPTTTVREAIADLKAARPLHVDGGGMDWWTYTTDRNLSSYARRAREPSPFASERCPVADRFSGHRYTAHSPEVARRFAELSPGAKDLVGKHIRLDWNGLCPALRAGTGSDRGSYQSVRPIHPAEDRVITVREAARLQGFPDWFVFHPAVWHSFRMIGNSVCPTVGRSVLSWVGGRRLQPRALPQAAE